MHTVTRIDDKEVVLLSWRDTANPEGGGAELYLQKIAAGLVHRGAKVTIFCAAHDGAADDEVVDGIRYVRRGTKLTVYLEGMRALRRGDLGDPDVVVDVQNGLPFFSRLVTRKPVIVLVHHVHREQWPVVYPGLTGRIGWFVERRVAPWLYRHCQYVAVSRATATELAELGVARERVAVVHNGTEPAVLVGPGKSPQPLLAVVGRLVPHKRVEHAIDAVATLRHRIPGLRLAVIGGGWWEHQLREYADAAGVADAVSFEGHVDEARKHEVYDQAWVLALPSLKEGWGLVIGEAGMHATPAVAYRSAGGTEESIDDHRSGLLVDDQAGFTDALEELLVDSDLRSWLGDGALEMSHSYTWERAQESFALVLRSALDGRLVDTEDPASPRHGRTAAWATWRTRRSERSRQRHAV